MFFRIGDIAGKFMVHGNAELCVCRDKKVDLYTQLPVELCLERV